MKTFITYRKQEFKMKGGVIIMENNNSQIQVKDIND